AARLAAPRGGDRVVWDRGAEPADDALLGALVHLGHEVGRLPLERDAVRRAKPRLEHLAGGACRVDRHLPLERGDHQSRRSLGTSSAAASPTAISATPFTPSATPTPQSDASAPT